MSTKKGLFIVIYGVNNLGKTTQVKLLIARMKKEGYKAEYLKYPIYDLAPFGPILNDYLRSGNPYNFSPLEIQTIYALNRYQFESELRKKINQGINVVAEDYIGTGLAWGIGAGVRENFLKELNAPLLKENLAFLLYGKRFKEAIENGHHHEENEELTEKVRLAHEKLATELGWIKINANQPIEQVAEEIWNKFLEFDR